MVLINNLHTLHLLVYLNNYYFTSQSSYVRTKHSTFFALSSQVLSTSVELWLHSRFYVLIYLRLQKRMLNPLKYYIIYLFRREVPYIHLCSNSCCCSRFHRSYSYPTNCTELLTNASENDFVYVRTIILSRIFCLLIYLATIY